MADSFADLWQSSAPTAKPQTLSSLSSSSNPSSSSQASNARGSTPAQNQRKTPDVFALLASSSKPSSASPSPAPTSAYRASATGPQSQPTQRTSTASPASLSSAPSSSAYLTPGLGATTARASLQPASRPSSTHPPPPPATATDAFGDLFSSAAGTGLMGTGTANMTLAARARMEQAQKAKQQQQQKSTPTSTQSAGMDAWAGLDALGGGATSGATARGASGTTPARADDVDDWGLGDFGAASSSSTPGLASRSTSGTASRSTIAKTDSRAGAIIDATAGEEDDWGLGDFGAGQGSRSGSGLGSGLGSTAAPPPQDEDDILGMLSMPVQDVRAVKASSPQSHSQSPSPPISSHRASRPSLSTSSSASSTARDPPPHILGQIVEMGFSIPQARSALLQTAPATQDWDVQAALDLLLAQQHENAEGSPPRRGTPPPRHISSQQPAWGPEPAERPERVEKTERAPPKGRRERDAERQERLAKLERELAISAAAHPPDASGYTDPYYSGAASSSAQTGAATAAELAQHAERVLSLGKEVGRGVLGRASAFWREGRERVEKVLEERGGVEGVARGVRAKAGGVASGIGSRRKGSGASRTGPPPRWMQEGGYGRERDDEGGYEHGPGGLGGYADDKDDHGPAAGGGWDDDGGDDQHMPEDARSRGVTEVDLFNVDDDGDRGLKQTNRERKIKMEEEVDLFSMPVPTRAVAPTSTSSTPASRPSPARTPALGQASTSASTRPRTLTPAAPSALAAASTHRTAGTAAFKLGQYADAAAGYARALDALPAGHLLRVPLLTNRALALLRTGEAKGAERDCAAALGVVVGVSAAGDEFEPAAAATDANGEKEKERAVDAWTPAMEPPDLIDAARAKAHDAGWASADGVGVDLTDGYIKARRRRAEALEMQEKWARALRDWDALAGAVWVPEKVRGEARGAAARCRRMVGADSAGGGGGSSTTSTPSAAAAPSRPKPRPPFKRPPTTTTTTSTSTSTPSITPGTALKALQTSTAQAEAEDTARHALKDAVDARLAAWRAGKETNVRALLASLDAVLWPEILAGGVQVSGLGALITPAQVKKGYVRAIGRVHPDKLNPSNSTVEQRMLANGVFGTLNEAWIAFQAGVK